MIHEKHPSHSDDAKRLKRIKGQIEGIIKMIEEDRYCSDILQQVKAANSALKAVERSILARHMHHCLLGAAAKGDRRETEKKINEIIQVLGRI